MPTVFQQKMNIYLLRCPYLTQANYFLNVILAIKSAGLFFPLNVLWH
jgi:hypothetical protein